MCLAPTLSCTRLPFSYSIRSYPPWHFSIKFFFSLQNASRFESFRAHLLNRPIGKRTWKNFIFLLRRKNEPQDAGVIEKRERENRNQEIALSVIIQSTANVIIHIIEPFHFPWRDTHFSFNGMWQRFYFSIRSNEKRLPFLSLILNRLVGSNITRIIWTDKITKNRKQQQKRSTFFFLFQRRLLVCYKLNWMLLAGGGGEKNLGVDMPHPHHPTAIENGRIAPDDWIPFSNFCVGRLQCRITNSFFHRETVEWLRPVKLDANEVMTSIVTALLGLRIRTNSINSMYLFLFFFWGPFLFTLIGNSWVPRMGGCSRANVNTHVDRKK